MLNFFDFEVFKYDWLVVIINPVNRTKEIIINDPEELTAYYEAHKNEIWVGYNSRGYDQFILKGILLGFNPKEINDFIIVEGKKGYQFSSLFKKIPLNNYDVYHRTDRGLKTHEGFMGHDIKESEIPFDIDRKLTDEEINETVKYCQHDVEETIEVFLRRKNEFDARMGLIKMFNLNISCINQTDAQLTALVLDAHRQHHNDEFDIEFPPTLKVEKYREVVEWYENPANRDYSKSLEIDIAGVPHIFAWGGIHGAIPQYYGEGYFVNMDVRSYYPSLMIEYGWLSRNVSDPKKFKEIYDRRVEYKAAKDSRQEPLKNVLNGTYGASKDKFNNLYDPRQANNVCVGGQLLLLDLIEKLEPHCQIIQSNTDGILVKLNKLEDYDLIDDIAYEWECRTGMNLEFDLYKKIYQKDVNNYLIVDMDGKAKSKGAYVKKLSDLDYDLPIVNKAIIDYMTKNTPVEATINACDELRMFQKIVKVSGKYLYALHGDKILNDKTLRVFASKKASDGGVFKLKNAIKGNPEKFANTPEKCFIDNSDITDRLVPPYLNKQWYIDLALERLNQFGVI
jgi:DNA polymerase